MRVGIYARHSSDNQRDASIADQIRVCRQFAERQGWQVLREYSDHAISGATLLRPGFQTLMREASFLYPGHAENELLYGRRRIRSPRDRTCRLV
jgi:DNA invertase Pin-like site-specific DNA recombinase